MLKFHRLANISKDAAEVESSFSFRFPRNQFLIEHFVTLDHVLSQKIREWSSGSGRRELPD